MNKIKQTDKDKVKALCLSLIQRDMKLGYMALTTVIKANLDIKLSYGTVRLWLKEWDIQGQGLGGQDYCSSVLPRSKEGDSDIQIDFTQPKDQLWVHRERSESFMNCHIGRITEKGVIQFVRLFIGKKGENSSMWRVMLEEAIKLGYQSCMVDCTQSTKTMQREYEGVIQIFRNKKGSGATWTCVNDVWTRHGKPSLNPHVEGSHGSFQYHLIRPNLKTITEVKGLDRIKRLDALLTLYYGNKYVGPDLTKFTCMNELQIEKVIKT